jgi:hypothetical protein
MTVYYVGVGGSNGNSGTSWANRKLTLNGAEDVPVVAGDTVYVAPGVYRETLTVDVSGSSGSPITYIGDVDGSHTDGVGGIVRITGSDDDLTATRGTCITATSKNYRTFRGFACDTSAGISISLITACSNWIIEDCHFNVPAGANAVSFAGTGTADTIRRCEFYGGTVAQLIIQHSSTVSDKGHLVENCIFCGNALSQGLRVDRVGGCTVRHCLFIGLIAGIRIFSALTVGQTTTTNNNILTGCSVALQTGTAVGTNEEITENYNNFFANNTNRTNVSTGANSVAYSPLFLPSTLLSGFVYPRGHLFALSPYSAVRRLAGTGMSSDEFYGLTRPVTDSKKSWGPFQFNDISREVTTVRTGSASLKLADAGRFQMFVPTTNVSTVFSCYVQWEADYTGTKPQMVIKQPGQSDTTVTATGSSGSWELLTATLTPAASPGFCIVEFVSNNTAAATNFDCFFDDFSAV